MHVIVTCMRHFMACWVFMCVYLSIFFWGGQNTCLLSIEFYSYSNLEICVTLRSVFGPRRYRCYARNVLYVTHNVATSVVTR